jgi:hypothetical protein
LWASSVWELKLDLLDFVRASQMSVQDVNVVSSDTERNIDPVAFQVEVESVANGLSALRNVQGGGEDVFRSIHSQNRGSVLVGEVLLATALVVVVLTVSFNQLEFSGEKSVQTVVNRLDCGIDGGKWEGLGVDTDNVELVAEDAHLDLLEPNWLDRGTWEASGVDTVQQWGEEATNNWSCLSRSDVEDLTNRSVTVDSSDITDGVLEW